MPSLVERCDELLWDIQKKMFEQDYDPLENDKVELLNLIVQILKIAPAVDLETFNP